MGETFSEHHPGIPNPFAICYNSVRILLEKVHLLLDVWRKDYRKLESIRACDICAMFDLTV